MEALLLLLLGVGLFMFVSGLVGKEVHVAGHKIVGGVDSKVLRFLLGAAGVGVATLAIWLGVTYLEYGGKDSERDPVPSATVARNEPGGGQLSNPEIDPLSCFGTPLDVNLDPASGPAGTWTRVHSQGYIEGEKVRVDTWAGSTWEAIADGNGAISVRAQIPEGVPSNSVTVYVHGTKSKCGGDALFRIE